MPKFDLSSYQEVKTRLPKFYELYPDGRVITVLCSDVKDLTKVLFVAYLYKNKEDQERNLAVATGFSYEVEGDGYINETSHVENSETSAIGRALANIGLHGSQRPCKEEMQKVERMQNEKVKTQVLPDNTTIKPVVIEEEIF